MQTHQLFRLGPVCFVLPALYVEMYGCIHPEPFESKAQPSDPLTHKHLGCYGNTPNVHQTDDG